MLLSLIASLLLLPAASFADKESPLFQNPAPISLSLSGDFMRVKEANGEGNWKEEDRSDPKYWSAMELRDQSHPERLFTGRLRARGMSSGLDGEGDFPKLKIEISKNLDREGSAFEGAREFRINTHVSTHPKRDRTDMGRLNDERSPYREALAYDWSEALGFPTFGHRRADIHYRDSGERKSFRRKALLLETDKNFAKRAGGRIIEPKEFAERQETGITSEDSAAFHLFESLLGNKDFILRVSSEPRREDKPIWGCGNCVVVERDDGRRTVSPYDFDLSTFVAGEEKIRDKWQTYPEFGFDSEEESYLAWALTSLKARHPEQATRRALARFTSRKDRLASLAQDALIDDIGRKIALRHMDRFFAHVGPILALPVIAQTGTPFVRSPRDKTSKLRPMPSGETAYLRPSTPVKILERVPGFLKVAILDFHWDLAEEESSVGFIPEGTAIAPWVPAELIAWRDDRDQPEPDSRH